MPVVGIVNQKGGVGKTTTAVNLAACLAARGCRTLLVDADPQGNATTGFGIEKSKLRHSLYDVLAAWSGGEGSVEPNIARQAVISISPSLDVLPATLDLAGSEALLHSTVGKELILREALDSVRGDYEWILIDGPPSLGLLTVNILAASDWLLVPLQCEFYALEGLSQLMRTVEVVRKRIHPGLQIGKVLLTMVDTRNRVSQQVADEARGFFGDKVATTHIPRNVRLSEAPSYGEAAVTRYASSKGASAYQALAEEVLGACAAV